MIRNLSYYLVDSVDSVEFNCILRHLQDLGDYADQFYAVQTVEGDQIANLIAGYIDIIVRKKKDKDYFGIEGDEENTMFEDNVTPAQLVTHHVISILTLTPAQLVWYCYISRHPHPHPLISVFIQLPHHYPRRATIIQYQHFSSPPTSHTELPSYNTSILTLPSPPPIQNYHHTTPVF